MPFDMSCLNLNSCVERPYQQANIESWQIKRELAQTMFKDWKERDDKKVEIDGVKYKLVQIGTPSRFGSMLQEMIDADIPV